MNNADDCGWCDIRVYAELNSCLPPEKRQRVFTHLFTPGDSLESILRGLGIAVELVDVALVNGESAPLTYRPHGGELISVYPVFESFNVASLGKIRPEPLRQTRFVLDAHLGRLAKYLRMMGFDSAYRNDYSDDTLAAISISGKRILLSRDTELLKRKSVTRGYRVKSENPREQAKEVLERFDLYESIRPFTRCVRCNGNVEPLPKDRAPSLPPVVLMEHENFWRCGGCGKVYWRGTHYRRMERFLAAITRR
ncbi:MAG: twitching motility protein PilT [Nitrospinae bacterium]|nr:twitching motility protein PilT [Nitrospinota bacterium]